MGVADATDDTNQRIENKIQNIEELEDQLEQVHIQIVQLQASGESYEELDRLYELRDSLQDTAYTLFEIPEYRYQRLLEVKQSIIDEYEDQGILDDVFIDHSDESIQVILHTEHFESNREMIENTSTLPVKKSTRDVGDIVVEAKHFTESAATGGDRICVDFLKPTTAGYNVQCSQMTIAFPATRGNSTGFVTVAHGFGEYQIRDHRNPNNFGSPGSPSGVSKVYSPGPSFDDDAVVVLNSGQLSDRNWQIQWIGTLDYIAYNGDNLDSAFVELKRGKTIDVEVNHYGRDIDIGSYLSGDPRVGQFVYKTGAVTGTTGGFIKNVNPNSVYAAYQECDGDSGSPVGNIFSEGYRIYGMHLGLADARTFFDQASCNDDRDRYSRFIIYSDIVSQIGIRGTTS